MTIHSSCLYLLVKVAFSLFPFSLLIISQQISAARPTFCLHRSLSLISWAFNQKKSSADQASITFILMRCPMPELSTLVASRWTRLPFSTMLEFGTAMDSGSAANVYLQSSTRS